MSANHDISGVVRSWIREEEHDSADHILEVVLSRLNSTPQRRSWWPTRRKSLMTTYARVAFGAAAVLLAAFVGLRFIPVSSVGPLGPSPTPVPTRSPDPCPALATHDTVSGCYRVGSGITSRVTVSVPPGWTSKDDWMLVGPDDYLPPRGIGIRFYKVNGVYSNPLDYTEGYIAVGPTVEALAAALALHPGWEATGPTSVTVGGHPGRLVRWTIPADSLLGPDGKFLMFGDAPKANGWGVWGIEPGQVFDIHIVDSGGERVIVEAFHYPDTTAGDLAALQAVIDSIEIEPAAS